MENDHQIWQRFKAGDRSVLSFVYFQYFQPMFQYGIKFNDDPEFIKDCIQDVFLNLIKAGENLGPTDNIKYYLFKAVKNSVYKELLKRKKSGPEEFNVLKFDAPFALEEEIEEQDNASNKDLALLGALKKLSGRQREIIYLRYECGLEYDQICEIMQLKNDSARKLVFRAIQALKYIISPMVFLVLATGNWLLAIGGWLANLQ